MNCKYCGKQIEDDSRFCNLCGKEQNPSRYVEIETPYKEISLLTKYYKLSFINQLMIMVYAFWVAINGYLWASAYARYEDTAKHFYPFKTNDVNAYNIDEFIVFTILLPLVIFGIWQYFRLMYNDSFFRTRFEAYGLDYDKFNESFKKPIPKAGDFQYYVNAICVIPMVLLSSHNTSITKKPN